MNRSIFTFAQDGTGTQMSEIFGSIKIGLGTETGVQVPFGNFLVPLYGVETEIGAEVQLGLDLQFAETLEEARNTVWEWVAVTAAPDSFTWEFLDDSIRLSFQETSRTLIIENEGNEPVLMTGLGHLYIKAQ